MSKERDKNRGDRLLTAVLRPALYGLVALLLGVLARLVSDLLFDEAFLDCLGNLYILVVILLIILGVVVGLPYTQNRFRRWYLVPILYVVVVVVFFWFVWRSCPDCPIEGRSDQETIMKMIEAEGAAVVSEDLVMIQKIFADDAIIVDASTGYQLQRDDWYSTLFKNKDFLEAEQYEFHPVAEKSTNDTRLFTTGSRGRYRDEEGIHSYDNRPGSNEWTLEKDSRGCWVIVKFRFNVP